MELQPPSKNRERTISDGMVMQFKHEEQQGGMGNDQKADWDSDGLIC